VTNRFHKLELETTQRQEEQTESPIRAEQSSSQIERDALHDAKHWMRLAERARRTGSFEDALRYYSRAVELDRSLVAGWVGQVRMLIALDEYKEAELWSRKALELFKSHADLHAARAQALCRDGDMKSALAACDAALGQTGQLPYPWMARGDIMLARRDPIEEHCFNKAVQLDADWLILIEVAGIYEHYRRHAKALMRYSQAVERAPDQAYCWYLQGRCQVLMGLPKPARQSFKQCLDLEPKHFAAREAVKQLDGPGTVRRAVGKFFGRG
jgi:tetratricopeptide (TPR) repeat protein